MFKSVFISAERSNLTKEENRDRTNSLSTILRGLLLVEGMTIELVQGYYKGTKEVSFKVTGDINEAFFKVLSDKFDQESILFLDRDDNAILWFTESKTMEPIGRMIETNSTEGLDNYSIIGNKIFKVA